MRPLRGVPLAFLLAILPTWSLACEIGQVLEPGESCELTVQWGTDHWIEARFRDGQPRKVSIEHLEGDCQVSLFGPIETDEVIIGSGQEPVSRALEGEYHLFTRAIVVARQTCRFRISVE